MFVETQSNVEKIRRRVKSFISTIISDIEEYHTDSQGARGDADDLSEPRDSETDDPSTFSKVNSGQILDWSMSFSTYEILRPKLPKCSDSYKVIVDFEDGYLNVRVIPGDLHGAASTAFNYPIESWANNLQPVPPGIIPSLRNRSDACSISCLLLWLMQVDYKYDDQSSKSPDNSFVPRNIQAPPAKLKPGTNIPYPTLVIEVYHKHEGWKELKRDAKTKAFSQMTSIQIIIGIKLFTSHFRVFWAHRSPTGTGMNIQGTTPKLDVQIPTNLTFTLPKSLVFWSVPQVSWPVTPTPNLILHMETLRMAIADLF